MNRRNLLKLGAAGTIGSLLYEKRAIANDIIQKNVADYDLIIAGGGPAGIGAAVMASRLNLKTLVIEKNGCLGGVWTAGLLCYVMDQGNKPGVNKMIIEYLNKYGNDINKDAWSYIYHPEDMKYILELICDKYDIDIRYHSKVYSTKNNNGNIESIRVASHAGIEEYKAGYYIDATGNGDLSAFAGADFDLGHPDSGKTQPMTLMGLFTGINEEAARPYIRNYGRDAKKRFLDIMKNNDIYPSYEMPTLWKIDEQLYGLMTHHAYGFSAINAKDITKATLEGRKELNMMLPKLRKIDGFKNANLVATAEQIGIREGRRVHGLYTVTKEDMIKGAKHQDAICKVNFGIDIHSLDPSEGKSISSENKTRTQPYDIPSRALISRQMNNLLMAGRCISGDFYAHSSYRVTGNAVAMGEGAAMSIVLLKNHLQPGSVGWNQQLEKMKEIRGDL